MSKKIFFSTYIMSFLMSYLSFNLASFYQLSYGGGNTSIIMAQLGLALIQIILALLAPFGLVLFFIKFRHSLNNKFFSSRFGSLYSGLNTKSFLCLLQYVIFMTRRVLLPLTIVFAFSHPYLQLVVHQGMNLVYLVWVFGLMPFKSNESNYLEMLNESVLCIISLFFFAFLDILEDNNQKRNLGQLMIFIVLAMLLVNLIIWFKNFVLSLVSKLDLYLKQLLQCCCIKDDKVVQIKPSPASDAAPIASAPTAVQKFEWQKQFKSESALQDKSQDPLQKQGRGLWQLLKSKFRRDTVRPSNNQTSHQDLLTTFDNYQQDIKRSREQSFDVLVGNDCESLDQSKANIFESPKSVSRFQNSPWFKRVRDVPFEKAEQTHHRSNDSRMDLLVRNDQPDFNVEEEDDLKDMPEDSEQMNDMFRHQNLFIQRDPNDL